MYPHNTDLEKSVIGCLLLEKSDYIIRLHEKDFLNETNKLIFKAISYLYDKKIEIDIISVSDILKKKLDNALDYISNLTSYVPTPENITHYIDQLQIYTMRREVMKAADKAKERAMEGDYESALSLKNDVQQLFDIKTFKKQNDDCSISSLAKIVEKEMGIKSVSKEEGKLFTGYYDLDRITAGFHPEELTLIAARPGVGKTAFALQILIRLAKKGNSCLFVSREMSNKQIVTRILASESDVDGHKMRLCRNIEEKEWQRIGAARHEIETLPIEINDKLASVQEIRAYCRELKTAGKLDILILDYLQLCKSLKKSENRRQEVEDISRQLKEMSLEFNIPVIALSQLSRESVNSGEPELHHLRESGSLEQDADNVIFLHIPKDTNERAEMFEIKVIVAKQRNGPTGYIMLRYYRRTFRLCNLT